MRKAIVVGFMVMAALWSPLRSDAVTVFTEDFNDLAIDPAITSPSPLAVDVSPNGQPFLGLLDAPPINSSNRGLSNTTVNLAVNPAPHTAETLAFTLYIIATMDGGELFTVSDNTGILFNLNCNNLNGSDGCSSPFNVSSDVSGLSVLRVLPPTTGFTDGNGGAIDEAEYRVSLAINRSSAALSFSYSGVQEITDESWGLDTIVLTTNAVVNGRVPEPGAVSLIALGLLGLGGLAVRRRLAASI